MSTEWTAERLDALPEATVIEWLIPGARSLTFFTKDSIGHPDRPWAYSRGGCESSESIILQLAPGESIRVVSVPVDALLADDTIAELANYLAGQIEGLVLYTEARIALRAALRALLGEDQ